MAESASNKQDTAELDAQLGTLLGDATAPAAGAQFEETEIGRAVDELLKKDAPKDDAAAIEALDAELAKLADTMVSGDFTDETTAAPAPVAEAPKPAAPAPQPVSTPPPVAPRPAPAPAPAKPAAPATPVAQPAPVATATPVATEPAPSTPAAVEPAPAKHGRAAAAGIALLEVIKPPALKAAIAISSPLRGRPPIVRDLVGWAALITVFWAVCLWGYVLLFRKADPPTAADHASATSEHAAAPAQEPASHEPASHEPTSHDAAEQASGGNRTPPKRPDPPKRPKPGEAPPQQAAAQPDAHGGH